jgi:hypothetical protein
MIGLKNLLYGWVTDQKEQETKQTLKSLSQTRLLGPASKVALLSVFPEEFHPRLENPITAKELQKLLTELYEKYPDEYPNVVNRLIDLSKYLVYANQIFSPRYEDFNLPKEYLDEMKKLHLQQQQTYKKYYNDPKKLEEELDKLGAETLSKMQEKILSDERLENNSFVIQTKSGARGNPSQLTGLLFSDVVYSDNKGRLVPVLINRRFIQGLYPHQIWAGSYGARFGLYFQQHGTQVSGAINKQLIQRTHDLVVTSKDTPDFYKYKLGYPVETSDPDAAGSLLAQETAGIPQNTLITPQLLAYFKQKGIDKILIRSPIATISKDGQLSAYDIGIRERGTLPAVGDFAGVVASQSITEPLTQAQLSAKHTGGIRGAGKAQDFLELIMTFFEPSDTSGLTAIHSDADGKVKKIEELDVGGKRITIQKSDGSEIQYYASPDDDILVKEGDKIEAGDMIIDGIPNLSKVVKNKGIGEGRKLFVKYLDNLLQKAGIKAHKRNLEIISTGIVNQVIIDDDFGPFKQGDIVSYNKVAYYYKPRKSAYKSGVDYNLVGKYLEEPVLHYSIGTPIKPSVVDTLKEFGIKEVLVHDKRPPFTPVFYRLLEQMEKSEDWMARMLGQHLQKGLIDAAVRGLKSDFTNTTSFVAPLAKGTPFGLTPYTRGPSAKTIEEARKETQTLRKKTEEFLKRLAQ